MVIVSPRENIITLDVVARGNGGELHTSQGCGAREKKERKKRETRDFIGR
jgi:hypothetical protein